jgi:hypothetical protein
MSIHATSGHLYRFDDIWCTELYIPEVQLSTRKLNVYLNIRRRYNVPVRFQHTFLNLNTIIYT